MKKYNYFGIYDDYNETLKRFITEYEIEIPIYFRHLGKSIRFNFDQYSAAKTHALSCEILTYIFQNKNFFYCCYGEIGIPQKRLKQYIKGRPNKPHCIEYHSLLNREDFEYEFDNISFVEVSPNTFNFNKFTKLISYGRGLDSNEYFISLKEKIVVHFYDSRGMDIVSLDNDDLIESLKKRFEQYPYWSPKI